MDTATTDSLRALTADLTELGDTGLAHAMATDGTVRLFFETMDDAGAFLTAIADTVPEWADEIYAVNNPRKSKWRTVPMLERGVCDGCDEEHGVWAGIVAFPEDRLEALVPALHESMFPVESDVDVEDLEELFSQS